MGRVSKKPLSKEFQQSIKKELRDTIISLTDKNEVEDFLDDFLTDEEKLMLGKRILLYMFLLKGFTNEEIHTILGTSYETIRWYKELLATKGKNFRKQLERRITTEKVDELWKQVEQFMKPFSLALRAKSDMKARAKLLNGDY